MSTLAVFSVDDAPSLRIAIDVVKWHAFLAAAETFGRDADTLLSESIDLCMDTTIAIAKRQHRDDDPA